MTETPDLPPYYHLVSLDTVDSTNEEAKRLARRGPDAGADGTLVWAARPDGGPGPARTHLGIAGGQSL